jgi:hypothetical protein
MIDIGRAINDTFNIEWIKEVNSMVNIDEGKVRLDIKLVGVTFDFLDEDRQWNIDTIRHLDYTDFRLRRFGSTGLDVVAYCDENYVGSVGWIPKEVARPISQNIDNLRIEAKKYQVSNSHIVTEDSSFMDLPVDITEDNFDDFADDFSKNFVFGIKMRFYLLGSVKLLPGG